MHTAGQQLVEVTVEQAVVRDFSARRSLTEASRPGGFELGGDGGIRERQAQVAHVNVEGGGAAGFGTVPLDLNYQSPNVEIIEPAAATAQEPEQRPVRVRRSRRTAAADADDASDETAALGTLVFQRELADIFACIFAEAQAAGRLDALVGSDVRTLAEERN